MKAMRNLGLAALLMFGAVPANAEGLGRYELVVINNTGGSTITSIYAQNVETGSNKGDVLPGTITYGDSETLNLDDGSKACAWRLRAELANDKKTPWRTMNICSLRTWTITEN